MLEAVRRQRQVQSGFAVARMVHRKAAFAKAFAYEGRNRLVILDNQDAQGGLLSPVRAPRLRSEPPAAFLVAPDRA